MDDILFLGAEVEVDGIEEAIEAPNVETESIDIASLKTWSTIALKKYLIVRNKSTSGTTDELIARLIPFKETTAANCLWLNAHVGVGLYIYNCGHLRRAATWEKILYSSYGTVMFNFGTILLWATCKNMLPKCDYVRSIFGVLSGLTVLIIGREYLRFVDKSVEISRLEVIEE